MKLKISNLRVLAKEDINIKSELSKAIKVNASKIDNIDIVKMSIDARKQKVYIVYTLLFEVENYKPLLNNKNISLYTVNNKQMTYPKYKHGDRPIIVGFGPSGMFSALYLARCHANPIILERGSKVEKRIKDINNFEQNMVFDKNSNINFGEGGAGTFSDGKLQTNLRDPLINFIIEEFVNHGGPNSLLYEAKPHIGTDNLRVIVKKIREEIVSLGGTFYFDEALTDINSLDESLLEITTSKNNTYRTNHLILGIGHSARDTFSMIYEKGFNLEAKPFSIGLRIEHKREYINKIQNGAYHKFLPAASYKMAVHLKNGRSLYTFCMCPGGRVMASATEDNTIVTNGMSNFARDDKNSNSALLVNVGVEDYYKNSVLDGVYFQEKCERAAFNNDYKYSAPGSLVGDFIKGKVSKGLKSVEPTYPHGLYFTNFKGILPDFVIDTLKTGLKLMNNKMHGFVLDDAVLTGVETRSSSPIRILRENRESNIRGVYPVGEGAGYAGGITSSALDGLKTALYIMDNLEENK